MYNNPDFFVGFFSVNRGFWTVLSLEKYLRIVTEHTSKRQFPNYLLPLFLKWDLVLNHAYESEFSLHVNENF